MRAVLAATCCLWGGALAGQVLTEYPFPFGPQAIASGPDGNLWVTAMSGGNGGGSIWRIPPSGVGGTEFLLPTYCQFQAVGCDPYAIVAGPDGNIWASMASATFLARITMSGSMTEFYDTPAMYSLTVGPDRGVWGLPGYAQIMHYGLDGGLLGAFSLPTYSTLPNTICTGPDGNLWYTAELETVGGFVGSLIGRMTPAGVATEFHLPIVNGIIAYPNGITPGPDGALWFAESVGYSDRIGRMTVNGELSEFLVSATGHGVPRGICVGPDRALWFTESNGSRVGRMTLDGSIREFALGTNCMPTGITAGPDGNIWFCETGCGKLGKIDLGVLAGQAASIPTLPTIGFLILGATLALIGALIVSSVR